MKEIIDLIVAFNQIQTNQYLFGLTQNNDYFKQNELTIDKQIESNKYPQIRVSSDLYQTICFTKKLISCVDYRRNVFTFLKRCLTKKCRNGSSGLSDNIGNNKLRIDNTVESSDQKSDTIRVLVALDSMDLYLAIDKNWNKRILDLVVIRFRVEDSLSWLSTLGGAYSSLGEYKVHFAVKAGQISISQLRLASITNDPNIIAKCGIYMAYSLCQQHRKSDAIKMIRRTLYPYISNIQNCDKIVKSMYSALCYRIKYFDTN